MSTEVGYVLLFSKYTGIDLIEALKNKMKLNEEHLECVAILNLKLKDRFRR